MATNFEAKTVRETKFKEEKKKNPACIIKIERTDIQKAKWLVSHNDFPISAATIQHILSILSYFHMFLSCVTVDKGLHSPCLAAFWMKVVVTQDAPLRKALVQVNDLTPSFPIWTSGFVAELNTVSKTV